MNETPPEEMFEYWLIDMDDAIERFLSLVSPEIAGQLDFSPASLSVLEKWLLSNYPEVAAARRPSEAKTLDGTARYVGEVFRSHLGGKWILETEDKDNAFHGLPQLHGMKGQVTQISPLTMVTAAIDRRTGVFIEKIFNNHVERAGNIGKR